ncbi:MAG: globin [Acidimicrobiales bacterium]|nr:globin [Actinomycetota bacterium]
MRLAVDGPNENLFLAVGGRPYFDRLVARFYEGVATDPVLRPLYPEDLTESVEHTAGFLAQFWGGGTTHYSDHRGHPRLRARHGHVPIGQEARDAWVRHMVAAVRESGVAEDLQARQIEYFEMAATHMINLG